MAGHRQAPRGGVESIPIDKTSLAQALRENRSGNVNFASQLSLQFACDLLEVTAIGVALGPTDLRECDMTHFGWLRHTSAKSRTRVPIWKSASQ